VSGRPVGVGVKDRPPLHLRGCRGAPGVSGSPGGVGEPWGVGEGPHSVEEACL
jgi:hypothetical protein